MAISLNNHETRIKALEDGVGRWQKLSEYTTLDTTRKLIWERPIDDVSDAIGICWYGLSTDRTLDYLGLIPLGHHFIWVMHTRISSTGTEEIICELNNTEKPGYSRFYAQCRGTVVNSSLTDNRIYSCWGLLKLCYNFSYNIYNKFYFVKFTLVRLFVQQYNRKTFYNAFKCCLDSLSRKRGVNRCLNKETC